MKRVGLARRLRLTPSGVTRLLEGLERAGLVERAACPSDLRVTYAQLTEAGREKVEAAPCAHIGPSALSCSRDFRASPRATTPARRPESRTGKRGQPSSRSFFGS